MSNYLILFILISQIYNQKLDNLFPEISVTLGNCNDIICPPHQGYCRADKCECLKGYLTIKDEKKYCNYKQKNTITALLLETFGLIGFGHLYAGRFLNAFFKLIVFYAIICFGFQFVIQLLKENSDSDLANYIKIGISISCFGTPIIWHFLDLYYWAFNKYLDGNGMPLLDW
jgi:hypothetical protein